MEWKKDKLNSATYVNRYGWTLSRGELLPCYEAVDWFLDYRRNEEGCSDGAVALLVGSRGYADCIVQRWIDHCVAEWMDAKRERLKALAILDEAAEAQS